MQEEKVKKVCGLDHHDINMKTPFIVMRKYQGRMMSINAKKQWKKLKVNPDINQFFHSEIDNLYAT